MPRKFLRTFLIAILSVSCIFCLQPSVTKANSIEIFRGGHIDYSFTPPPIYLPIDENVRSFTVQPDGKILAVGTFMPSLRYKLFRFLPDGQIDSSFTPYYPTADTSVEDFALQPDGKILYTKLTDGVATVFRLNSDGSLDTSFNYQSNGYIPKIVILPDGKILILNYTVVRRLNPNGEIDTSFSFAPVSNMNLGNKLIVQPDGKFVFSALRFTGSNYVSEIFRYNADGSRDETFHMNPITGTLSSLAVQSDGKVLTAGSYSPNQAFKRYNTDGSEDFSFNPQNTINAIESIAIQNDGRILISGSTVVGNPRTERLFADGSRDTGFISNFVRGTIYPCADGGIFVRGPNTVGGKIVGIVKLKGNYTPTRQKAFDFDGDGKADISVFRPSSGVWYWVNSSNSTFSAIQFGLSEDKPVPADYDGDTKADIAVYRPSTGIWHFLSSSNGQYSAYRFGIDSDIPTPNDYDGDGKDDISVFRPSSAVWYRVNSSTNQLVIQQFGNPQDKPVQGDYDSDGKSDIAVWSPSANGSGIWSYISSLNNSVKTYQLGYESDRLAPADFDGDGKTDFIIWRGANGGWYGIRSFIGNGFFYVWGMAGDIPVPADYDGDGRDDIAVWRTSTGEWWIGRTSDGTVLSYPFGLNGDIPLPSTFVR